MKMTSLFFAAALIGLSACSKDSGGSSTPAIPDHLNVPIPVGKPISQDQANQMKVDFAGMRLLEAVDWVLDLENPTWEEQQKRQEKINKATNEQKELMRALRDRCQLNNPKTVKTGSDEISNGSVQTVSTISSILGQRCPVETRKSSFSCTVYGPVDQRNLKVSGNMSIRLQISQVVRDADLAQKAGSSGLSINMEGGWILHLRQGHAQDIDSRDRHRCDQFGDRTGSDENRSSRIAKASSRRALERIGFED
jgi:hypothetical protein